MPTKTIDVHDVQSQLADLLVQVAEGTEIIITEDEQPRARIVPIEQTAQRPRIPGLHPGSIIIGDDFDEPLPDEFWLGEE